MTVLELLGSLGVGPEPEASWSYWVRTSVFLCILATAIEATALLVGGFTWFAVAVAWATVATAWHGFRIPRQPWRLAR